MFFLFFVFCCKRIVTDMVWVFLLLYCISFVFMCVHRNTFCCQCFLFFCADVISFLCF